MEGSIIAIDLKSFYASVECVERGLDPLASNLVVADATRTEKTICLAVSPPLKALGVPGRPRLFEVERKVREINALRRRKARFLKGESIDSGELARSPHTALAYVTATPRMALYMKYSARIYSIYLRHFSADDIHVYSIDEVFINAAPYLRSSGMTAHELAMTVIRDILAETGITSTAGLGTNPYLAKVAMDIVAKKMPPDKDGVRIAELDEMSYRRLLWEHEPLTDFWRIGPGIARRLGRLGLRTMGDVARISLKGEAVLYRMLGVQAELLIDHAWGWEPCTIHDIKACRPQRASLGSGQVLHRPYSCTEARLVLKEMAEQLSTDLVRNGLASAGLVLVVGYDRESLRGRDEDGVEIALDRYGRPVPKHARGTMRLGSPTASMRRFTTAAAALYDRIVNRDFFIRRLSLAAVRLVLVPGRTEGWISPAGNNACGGTENSGGEQHSGLRSAKAGRHPRGGAEACGAGEPHGGKTVRTGRAVQLSLLGGEASGSIGTAARRDRADKDDQRNKEELRDRRRQEALLMIRSRYGANAVMPGTSFDDCATGRERNMQIGGHKA